MTTWPDSLPLRRGRSLLARLLLAAARARHRRRHRHRHRLAELDDAILRDIGLTRDQARCQDRCPRWDAPGHWRN